MTSRPPTNVASPSEATTLLDTMIESLPGVAYFYDHTGRFLRWNKNFEIVSGYSSEEIARMHPLDFFSSTHKALLESRIGEVFEKGESSVEAPFVSRDGTETPYFFTGRRVFYEGGNCLVGVGIDITDRKLAEARVTESERKYRELVEHANSIILRWGRNGRVIFLNEFGQRFFGYSAEEIVGQHVVGTIMPVTESAGRDLDRLMEDIRTAPEAFEHNVNENVIRSGERVWISWTNRIVRDEQGHVHELLSIGIDITERKRAEEKLRDLEKQLLQAQKMEAIGQLAGGVAHDFNNILAAIHGNVQLALADTAEDHPARESLEEIKKASARAASLVRQILTFARHGPDERRVMMLEPTLREACDLLRATLPSSVELVLDVSPATPPVLADVTQVYQVVANLCTNAWHAMENKPGRIEVTSRLVTLDGEAAAQIRGLRPGRFARLSVSDTGKGIEAAMIERIFEPFFTTKELGTGLGLSVVHGIMQGHDGAISVRSQSGRGTTFELYFPAAAAPAEALVGDTLQAARGNGEHILYVDDEEPLVLLATRMLTRLGYRVTACVNALEARQRFHDDPASFDLVITDMNMPGVSGIELAADILKLRADVPVIVCSGYVTDELRELARRVGVREVLYKPASMQELGQAIQRLAREAAAARG